MDLLAVFSLLRRRWLAIVLCLLAGVGGGYDVGHSGTKLYRSTAQCLVNFPRVGDLQAQEQGALVTANLVVTYSNLVRSEVVVSQVKDTLAAEHATSAGSLSATVEPNTFLVDISSSASSPLVAQETADAAANALVKYVAELEAGLPQPITIQVTNPAVLPGAPYSPRPTFDLLVGLILGVLAGVGSAVLLESLDRSVKTVAQGDAVLGVPMVGLVPKRRGRSLVVSADNQSPDGEPYRSLRTAIRFLDPDRPLRTVLVTSPEPGEGKTVTAANLAAALAASGERVIAVDADLRVPRLAETFGLDRSVGLTSLVLGTADIDSALQVWSPKLSVLASGPLPPNPSEILGSQLVNTVMRELSERADIIVIDAPPVLPVADAVALSTHVDGVIMLVRHGHTSRSAAAEAARRLHAVGANFLGYVLNAVPRGESRGLYVDYRYYVEPSPARLERWSAKRGADV